MSEFLLSAEEGAGRSSREVNSIFFDAVGVICTEGEI